MDVLDAIYHRRAVRDFSDRPVSVDTIRDLIDAAIQAPSAMNLQPWGFAVVTDRRKLAAISKQAKAYLLDHLSPRSPLLRLRDDLASPAFNIFYNAPVLVVICATSAEAGAAEDCALAAQNFMLAAYANDLGTCWIGLSRAWLDQPEGKASLGVPPAYVPVCPIILGYPRGATEAHPRNVPPIVWGAA